MMISVFGGCFDSTGLVLAGRRSKGQLVKHVLRIMLNPLGTRNIISSRFHGLECARLPRSSTNSTQFTPRPLLRTAEIGGPD